MKQVSDTKYFHLRQLQKTNNTPFLEHVQGSRRTLIVRKRVVCTTVVGGGHLDIGEISEEKFISFLASFKRGLYNNIKKNSELLSQKIIFTGTSKSKNREAFNKIAVNDFYWNIDLVSAYWQMGYRLGYVSKSFYKKYMHEPGYKQVKRLAFSFLARTNYKDYTIGTETYRITCDNTNHQQIYDNVRNQLYLIIHQAVDIAGSEYIDYNIDSISVTKANREKIIKFFLDLGLEIKTNPVIKLSDREYSLKDAVRIF